MAYDFTNDDTEPDWDAIKKTDRKLTVLKRQRDILEYRILEIESEQPFLGRKLMGANVLWQEKMTKNTKELNKLLKAVDALINSDEVVQQPTLSVVK